MIPLFAVFCLFFFILLIYTVYKHIKLNKSLYAFDMFTGMYAITYGLVPCIILSLFYYNGINISKVEYYQVYLNDDRVNGFYLWLVLAFIGYFIFLISYRSTKKEKVKKDNHKLSNSNVFVIAIFFLFIGAISMYLWSRAYGGIFNLILVGSYVRSSVSDVTNSLAFFKHPIGLVQISTFMFLLLIKKKYRTFLSIIFFLTSLFLSICFLLANDGRMTTAFYFFVLILLCYDSFEKGSLSRHTIRKILITIVFLIILIFYLDSITSYIKTGEMYQLDESDSGLFSFIGKEFSYIYSSGQFVVNKTLTVGSPLLLLEDIKTGLLAWIPTSYKPSDLINVWKYNTIQLGSDYGTGTTPTDFITTMIYDLGLIGPCLLPAFWGWIAKRIDNWHVYRIGLFHNVIYAILSLMFLRLVNYNLLYDFVLGIFYVVIAIIIYRLYSILINKQ